MNDNKEIFTRIYKTNYWRSKESFSGPGAELRQTVIVRKELPIIVNDLNIKTILDIPCGDFNWMREINFELLMKYIGADIVGELVHSNMRKYGDDRREFVELDIIKDNLPMSDLIFCRDCFVHFSFSDIFKAMNNIRRSKSKYLLMTTFNRENKNIDTYNAKWRPINFQISPFNFCAPIKFVDTNFTDNGRQHFGNGMGLWRVSDL